MSNKDFLSQFSNENKKPASFNEEVRTPVQKEKKPINPWFFIVPAIVVLTAGIILYLLFIRPNIDVVNFVGQKQEDAVAWIRQQGIESNGIVFKEEYNFDNDENVIIDQIPIEGKVNYDAKMTFVLSKGPDPDEKVDVPNFEIMTKNEISEWIKNNKLTSTKINTTYSDTVENDGFIKAEYADCEESTFTRGCNLKISVSKGPKPVGEVEMQNFVKKNFEELEIWAATKEIKIERIDSYSDTYSENQIMAQSVKEKEIIKVGDTLSVLVSKGKAVIMEDFVGKPKSDLDHWASKNSVSSKIVYKKEYSNDYSVDDIISQSLKKGAIIENDVIVVVSLGQPKLDSSKTVADLRLWKETVNTFEADVHVGNITYENSDTVPAGDIIRMSYSVYVPVGASLNPVVSRGENILLKDYEALSWDQILNMNETNARSLCDANKGRNGKGVCIFTYDSYHEDTDKIGDVLSAQRSDGGMLKNGEYISQDQTINIVICEKQKEE